MEEGREDDREALDQLSMLADDLLQQAGDIRRQWTELAEVLGAELPADVERPAAPPARRPASATPPPATPEDDPIRLVALDMMLSGRSRDEVAEYLDATFGEGEYGDVLDEVFAQYG